MSEEKITLEMDRDIPVIRELNVQINHDDVKLVTKEYEAIMDLDVLHSASGAKYVKRLAQIMRHEPNEECVICNGKRMKEAVLCEECLSRNRNTPLFTDQRNLVREIMNVVDPPKEKEINHGSKYIGQLEKPNRASGLVLFFAVAALILIGYIICTRIFFQPEHQADYAITGYTPDEVVQEYEIVLEDNSQRYLAEELDVSFQKADMHTDDTGVTGYRITVAGSNTQMYLITYSDEMEEVRAVTVYACGDEKYERWFGGALLQLADSGAQCEDIKGYLDTNVGTGIQIWNNNYTMLYEEDSIILSSKSFFGNMGEAIKSIVGLEF